VVSGRYPRLEVAPQLASVGNRSPSRARREVFLDVGLAAAVFGGSLALLATRGGGGADGRELDLAGVLLAALASLPLVARRRVPLLVFVVTTGASIVLNALAYPPGPPVGPTVALYTVALMRSATRTRTGVTLALVAVFFAGHLAAFGAARNELPYAEFLLGLLLWGGAWILADRVRLRRERVAELERRALHAEHEAERERRLAAAEERTRIARDLHDSAGHAINVILVHAGAARLLAKQDPRRAQAAIETIEEVARETLGEIDQLVSALREDDQSAENGGKVEPPLGLAALDTLIERHRSAGLAVSIRARGPRRALPPALDQAAYRILQEALTNAARHGHDSAEVDITFSASTLELNVRNPTLPGAAAAANGHGIVGMRERAVLLGGTLEAGATNGVFSVRARLPCSGSGA
jgi:signal transduction histidine kinase